jgi:hypothetical protein
MSHATLTVALPGTLTKDEIEDALSAVLERYEEDRPTARYVKATRDELIVEGRAEIEQYRDGTYAEYLADPAAYAENCRNDNHLAYVSGTADDGGFPAKLTWTDDQVYADQIRWYDEENIGPEGEVYSTRNPDAKWDWYVIGGRWTNYWPVLEKAEVVTGMSYDSVKASVDVLEKIRPGASGGDAKYVSDRAARPGVWADVVRKMDIDFAHEDLYPATFAFLDSDGEWHEKGLMGWFGISSGDKEDEAWRAQYRELVAKEADNAWFVLVDYHI